MRRLLCLAVWIVAAPAARAGSLDGRWDATVTIHGNEIPFRIDFSGDGPSFTGTLFDGDLKVTSTGGQLENGTLVVNFGHYLTRLTATPKDGELDGKVEGRFERDKYISSYPFHARRHKPSTVAAGAVPVIDGLWEIPYKSPKGEKAWRLIVRQNGPAVKAAILRVDGDTGTLSGTYKDGKWLLSHFSGSRPLVLEIKPSKEGTLEILPSGAYTAKLKLAAYRPADARAKGLPEPADFDNHTTLKKPDQPFQFSFPDLDGKILSNNDPRFKGKVVVAVVTGTWCPNCHDEAQFLVQLDRKYRDRGLAHRGARLRRARAARRRTDPSPRLHQEVWRPVHVPDRRLARRDVGEGAPGCQPQFVADHVLHRSGRPREEDPRGLRQPRQRCVP